MHAQLLENISEYFLSLKSEKTNFIHFNHEDLSSKETISVEANLYYVLWLFSLKKAQSFQEGIELLKKLFYFQNPSFGLPRYLHESNQLAYSTALWQLTLLMTIQKWYQKYFPESFSQELQHVIDRTYKFIKTKTFRQFEDHFLFYCLAASSQDKQIYEPIFSYVEFSHVSEKGWEKILLGLKLLEGKISQEITKKIFEVLTSQYNFAFSVFLPKDNEKTFEKLYPKPSYIDLLFLSQFPLIEKRIEKTHPIWMKAGLVFALPDYINTSKKQSQNAVWNGFLENNRSFIYIWDKELLHSMVIETMSELSIEKDHNHFHFTVHNLQPDKEECFLKIYLSNHPDISIDFNQGMKATLFHAEDAMNFTSKRAKHQLVFEGNDTVKFVGQLHFGNRSNQMIKDKFSAFDWKIGLRLLHAKKDAKYRFFLLCFYQ